MLGAFANAFRTPDLRRKLLFVLLIIFIFRLGSQVPAPGVHSGNVQSCINDVQDNSVYSLINLFSGGALLQLTVFALVSVTPFLTDVAAEGPLLLVPVLGPMLLVRDGVAGGFELAPTVLALTGSAAVSAALLRRAVHLLDAEGSVLRSAR